MARRHWDALGEQAIPPMPPCSGRAWWKAQPIERLLDFRGRPSLPVSLVVAVIAISLAAWQALAIAGGYVTRDVPRGLESGEYVLEVVEDAKLGSYGYSVHARVLDANGIVRDVLATYGDADIETTRLFARQRVVASVSFSEFSEASFSRYASKGLCARAKLTQATIVDGVGPISFVVSARCFARDVFDEFEGRGAALVRAIVIGDRSKLEEGGLYDDVKTVGLAHMVAVSGAHLSVVAALAGALLTRVRTPRVVLSIMLCLFYCAYAAFTGFSAPVIRAALMAAVVVSAIWGTRRSSSLAALGVCVCVLLAAHPANALSLSFFLSAASTLGIVALAPPQQAWFEVAFGRRGETLCQTCALTTAISHRARYGMRLFTRALTCLLLANMIAAPVYGFIAGVLLGWGLPLCMRRRERRFLRRSSPWPRRCPPSWRRLRAFPSRLFHARPTCGSLSSFPHWRLWVCGPYGPVQRERVQWGLRPLRRLWWWRASWWLPCWGPTKSSRSVWGRARRFW